MKQTKFWMTTLIALLCSLTASAHDFEVDGIYYNITSSANQTVGVTYQGTSYSFYDEYSGTVTIPSAVTYNSKTYSVTSIGAEAFRRCNSLVSVTILEGTTIIGDYAFYGCSSLESITIPNSVTKINNYAFGYCISLSSITIPESVMSINKETFRDCKSLTSVTISNSVTSIGSNAFGVCI